VKYQDFAALVIIGLTLFVIILSFLGCTVDQCTTNLLAPTGNNPQCVHTDIP
jgi:hypothetical protein